jgi:hypothetical protein
MFIADAVMTGISSYCALFIVSRMSTYQTLMVSKMQP